MCLREAETESRQCLLDPTCLQLSDRLQIVSMLIMITGAGFAFTIKRNVFRNCRCNCCFQNCLLKGTITKSILVFQCFLFLFANTGVGYFSSASPHNDININVYGNELFFEEEHLFIFDSLM